jgi:hypothetical protein
VLPGLTNAASPFASAKLWAHGRIFSLLFPNVVTPPVEGKRPIGGVVPELRCPDVAHSTRIVKHADRQGGSGRLIGLPRLENVMDLAWQPPVR